MPDINALRQRIRETSARGREILARNNNNPTPEDLIEHRNLMDEVRRLGDLIEAEQRQIAAEAAAVADGHTTAVAPETGARAQSGELRTAGEFVARCLRIRAGLDTPRTEEERAFSMGIGEEGGVLIPTVLQQRILAISPEKEVVMPRVAAAGLVLPAGDPPDAAVEIPQLRQGALGALGGFSVAWIAEGAPKPVTDAKLDLVRFEPHEVATHVVATDKLLRNSELFGAWLDAMLREALIAARDQAFLTGDGIGKPRGLLHSECRLVVNRATSGAIGWADTLGMLIRLLPDSWGTAAWVASVTAMPQIVQLRDPAGNSIYIQGDATKNIPATLYGIPIIWTGRTPVLGNLGDLMLVDFAMYGIKLGSGPFINASPHVLFTTNRTVIKAFLNIDGHCLVKDPLTLDNGSSQVSPVVVLQ